MAKILIPRSDSISVKTIEPSDFEAFFSNDIINDYVKNGFTLSAGSGLSVNIAAGTGRLKGLFVNNSTSSSKGSLSANATNSIYVTLARDSNSEAESWSFTSNTSGTTPTDSLFIGKAVTNGSAVTSIDDSAVLINAMAVGSDWGDGSDGDVTISSNTAINSTKYYNNLTLNSGVTVTGESPIVIFARNTITLNGTITVNSCNGGAGGAGGSPTIYSVGGDKTGIQGYSGAVGKQGDQGYRHDGVTGKSGGAGGNGGSGGSSTQHLGGSNANQIYTIAHATGSNVGIRSHTPPATPLVHAPINRKLRENAIGKSYFNILANPSRQGTSGTGGQGGAGGGSGGIGSDGGLGGTGGAGGAGGGGGGSILIIAPTIIFNSGSILNAVGGSGGNGTAGTAGGNCNNSTETAGGGGGGGAGGNAGHGGTITFVYNSLTNSGTTSVIGGQGGTGGAGGARGENTTNQYSSQSGFAGSAGQTGSNGSAGIVVTFQV
tara:strand:+ start:6951 stop:8417 length:1467 start_codon:yes stop_codon:yes gene_type:complete